LAALWPLTPGLIRFDHLTNGSSSRMRGAWAHVDGLVVLGDAGAFLIKDLFLLGAALWTASEALEASRKPVGAA